MKGSGDGIMASGAALPSLDLLRQAMHLPRGALDLPQRAVDLPQQPMDLPTHAVELSTHAMDLPAAPAGAAFGRAGPTAAKVVRCKLLVDGRLATASKVIPQRAKAMHHHR